MTQEEKQLLLKDICERLSYGVKVNTWYNKPMNIKCVGVDVYTNTVNLDIPDDDDAKVYIDNAKPYLRPMSSMTEDEKMEYDIIKCSICPDEADDYAGLVDWLNSHYFDYRGLIGKGLAIEAPENMYIK